MIIISRLRAAWSGVTREMIFKAKQRKARAQTTQMELMFSDSQWLHEYTYTVNEDGTINLRGFGADKSNVTLYH